MRRVAHLVYVASLSILVLGLVFIIVYTSVALFLLTRESCVALLSHAMIAVHIPGVCWG